jgi:TPR repeat protein/serine/threonine protein kinase
VKEFEKEAYIMANCQHPAIVRLYGICTQRGQYGMVMEYLHKGSLYDVIHNTEEKLPWNPVRWQIAMDIEKGLAYLHSKEILHRDLKSLNVLLDSHYHAKIGDFGLSRIKVSSQSTATSTKGGGAGTTRWRAPEVFKRGVKPDKAQDIYSSGMVLWELASRQLPYADAADDLTAMGWIKDGEKETIPDDCPKEFGDIILSSWQPPETRPTAVDLINALQKVCPKLEPLHPNNSHREHLLGDKSWHFDPETPGIDGCSDKTYVLLSASDKDHKKVMQFYSHHAAIGYDVAGIEVIYNPNMNRKFALYMDELQNRDKNPAFMPRWQTNEPDQGDDKVLRQKTFELFEQYSKPYVDPDFPAVKLLPLWHGTKPEVLASLFTTGYANLATTDSGYFGKGIYGAWEAEYSQRVYSKGALILNWAAVFSPFPVIFSDMGRLRLSENKANYGNYDAHFVPVFPASKNPHEMVYYACKSGQAPKYTEVVVFQSAGFLPRYRIHLEKTDIKELTVVSKPATLLSKSTDTNINPNDTPANIFRKGYDCLHNDPQKAVDMFEAASGKGYLPADAALGFLHYTGKIANLGRDTSKSTYHYDRLKTNSDTLHAEAKKGAVDYQTALGFCYAYGIGIKQDYKCAANWYEMAAAQGDAKAQCNLALLYETGQGVKKSQKKAIKYYNQSAEKGDRTAMFNLGVCFYKGDGVKKDLVQACIYLKPLADEGDVQAQYFMGLCFLKGLGVPQDFTQGKAYLQKAANQGHKEAEQQLGIATGSVNPQLIATPSKSMLQSNMLPNMDEKCLIQ